jgi:hypothetical protein
MVWLDVADNNGNALYFVTDRIERLSGMGAEGFTISGILGDGGYEGEVIVEVGENPRVTFVDAWLARGDFSRFVASIDRERVSAALTEVAAGLTGEWGAQGNTTPRGGRGERPGRIAEDRPSWREVA